MKIQIISDIHLEHHVDYDFKKTITPKCDYLFIPGDIGHIDKPLFKEFMNYVSYNWKEVFYVPGNHEFYDNELTSYYEKYEYFFDEYYNIFFVDEESTYQLEDYIITGSIGFSLLDLDYNDDYLEYLNDFKYIKYSSGILTPWHNNIIARTQKETLYDTILKNKDKKIILMTHIPYGHHNMTSSKEFHDQPTFLTKYFCNTLDVEINKKIIEHCKIVIGGHTHHSYDYTRNGVRYISNQIGYKYDNNIIGDVFDI